MFIVEAIMGVFMLAVGLIRLIVGILKILFSIITGIFNTFVFIFKAYYQFIHFSLHGEFKTSHESRKGFVREDSTFSVINQELKNNIPSQKLSNLRTRHHLKWSSFQSKKNLANELYPKYLLESNIELQKVVDCLYLNANRESLNNEFQKCSKEAAAELPTYYQMYLDKKYKFTPQFHQLKDFDLSNGTTYIKEALFIHHWIFSMKELSKLKSINLTNLEIIKYGYEWAIKLEGISDSELPSLKEFKEEPSKVRRLVYKAS